MTPRPARLRLRRRLLLYSTPVSVVALLTAVKLFSVVLAGNSAVAAYAHGDGARLRQNAAVLGVLNVVEPAKAPFAAGVAAVLENRPEDADRDFTTALARTEVTDSCLVRVNLELVRETQGDRAAAAGDRSRADERYASALSVVETAPPACFDGNSDPNIRRQAIRHEAADRLAAKRAALNAPPPAAPSAPRRHRHRCPWCCRCLHSRPRAGTSHPGGSTRPKVIHSTSCGRCCRTPRAPRRRGPSDYGSADAQPGWSTSISVNTRRSSFPVAFRGSSSMNTTSRGTLWRARLSLTYCLISVAS